MQRDKKSKHISNGKIKYQDKLIFMCHFIDARFHMSITLINITRLKSCKNLALPKHMPSLSLQNFKRLSLLSFQNLQEIKSETS